MTDLDHLVRGLPHQARSILAQVWGNPGTVVPYPIPAGMDTLLIQGLVNVTDGRVSISTHGRSVLRHLEIDRHIATHDRLINVLVTVLTCGGQVKGLEQTFRDDFTPDELDLIAPAVAFVHETIERART
jgi:hypothetical protein